MLPHLVAWRLLAYCTISFLLFASRKSVRMLVCLRATTSNIATADVCMFVGRHVSLCKLIVFSLHLIFSMLLKWLSDRLTGCLAACRIGVAAIPPTDGQTGCLVGWLVVWLTGDLAE